MIKGKSLFLLLGICLPVTACVNPVVETVVVPDAKISFAKKALNKVKGSQIKVQFITSTYNSKAYSNATLPKKNLDIKSYKIFLTTDYPNPFTSGANAFGDGNVYSINRSISNDNPIIENVPDGGPYYAVVAAYDDVMENPGANNITKPDDTLLSIDKKWARSINTATVNIGGTVSYSDGSGALQIKLSLQHGIPPWVESSATILPGDPYTDLPTID